MKKNVSRIFMLFAFLSLFFISCKKEKDVPATSNESLAAEKTKGHLQQTKTFSSDVITTWINMQLQMMKVPLPPGTGSQASERCQAYCGIAAYEAVVNGMPSYQSIASQLNGLPAMPVPEPGDAYHWAASANAALAEMNRQLFPTTALANKARINFIEDSLKNIYATEVNAATLQRSIDFGKAVAATVAAWAATDGAANVNPPYVLPTVRPWQWVPTAATPPIGPYSSQRRLIVAHSDDGTALVPPPPYSTDPASAFYKMVKEVYDSSQSLSVDEKAASDYFKDVPGYSAGGTYEALLSQAIAQAQPTLDQAVLSYVKVGIAQHDATIVLFTNKYNFLVIRPITYIRANIDPTWNTYIPTPNHPEFPSGHSATNGAVLTMMRDMFGENFSITLHTYDYLGYPPRHYDNFTQMEKDISFSRINGGLHYRETCEKSVVQGSKVAENVLNKVHFKK
jgi:hypothetical protein